MKGSNEMMKIATDLVKQAFSLPELTTEQLAEALEGYHATTEADELKALIDKKTASRLLSVSLATVNRMIDDGRLASKKLGNCKQAAIRIPRDSIELYLQVSS